MLRVRRYDRGSDDHSGHILGRAALALLALVPAGALARRRHLGSVGNPCVSDDRGERG